MRNTIVALSTFAALTLVVPAHAATTLDLVERADTDTVSLKGGTAADNVGDVQTFHNPVYDASNTKLVGSDQGYCMRLVVGKALECHWTLILANGQIVVDGPMYDAGDTLLAITGGTGAYRGARGEILLHARDAKGTAFDFHYRLM